MRMVAKMAKLTPRPTATPQATRALVPGGSTARGPWGPKAIQYAMKEVQVSLEINYASMRPTIPNYSQLRSIEQVPVQLCFPTISETLTIINQKRETLCCGARILRESSGCGCWGPLGYLGGIFGLMGARRTSLLLLDRELGPAALHAVAQGHPEVSLLLERHALPSLLDVGEGGLGDCLGGVGPGENGGRAARDVPAQQVRGLCSEHDGRFGGEGGDWVVRRG